MWAAAQMDLHIPAGPPPAVVQLQKQYAEERPSALFWSLSPREFQLLTRRHMAHIRKEDYRAGIIAAILGNQALAGSKDKTRRPLTPASFFPSLENQFNDEEVKLTPQQESERMRAKLRAAFGGGR